MTVHVVGIGLDGAAGLSSKARQVVEMAALLVGSDRHLSYFPQQSCERWVLEDLTEAILEIRRWLAADANLEPDAGTFSPPSTPSHQLIVILVAGDPLFHGWGKLLISQLPPDKLTFHPHVSSVQLAFNRLHIPWQDAHFVGSQGRFFEELTAKLKLGVEKIAVLADETRTPAAIASLVQALDLPARYQFWVCENLGSAEERVGLRSLEALLGQSFAPLSVVVMLRQFPPATEALDLGKLPLLGIPDAAFVGCGDRPGLTVEREVRVLVLAQLALQPEQVVWDVGAGNGSVSIEIARLFPQSEVYAIEQTVSGTNAIELNCRRFELQNVFSIHGTAPEILHRLRPPHRIFIGGSGGGLTKILGVCALRLVAGGSIVLALDAFEDIATVLSWIGDRVRREPHWSYRIVQVQLSRSVSAGSLTRFDALNPISIVTIDRHLN
ncbi:MULTISPECIES: precorrin-6y C5,15-methyltransferase (decarboxylating) subunit CbiE [unclassified Microcoleus]|uniref:precorrin-6y C5,15-methyltransferase (decarboxylating) subunit CbiE n=1 Tax=unclassified Microcoleus TaxID=2642155 RepID=UPI002FCFEC0D